MREPRVKKPRQVNTAEELVTHEILDAVSPRGPRRVYAGLYRGTLYQDQASGEVVHR